MGVYQLEVSNKLGSWGAAGKVFRPGLYKITDEQLVEIARGSGPYVQVWQVEDGGGLRLVEPVRVDAFFDTAAEEPGPLTRERMQRTREPEYQCPKCGVMYSTIDARNAHLMVAHPAGDDFFEDVAPPEGSGETEAEDEFGDESDESALAWDEPGGRAGLEGEPPQGLKEEPSSESEQVTSDASGEGGKSPGTAPSTSETPPVEKPSRGRKPKDK